MKRIFLIVLDSVGIGEMPDAGEYGDKGTNTLRSVSRSPYFHIPNLAALGLRSLDGLEWYREQEKSAGQSLAVGSRKQTGVCARMTEASRGKDTTIGHWEIAGLLSKRPLPTFPNGFPKKLLEAFSNRTGRGVLCNKPYSGTDVIRDYGEEHMMTGKLIVYTSADSVFQIAAHEEVVPVEELYRYCEIARELLQGEYAVGRVIARPFTGKKGAYVRTPRRHDYSLLPPGVTMLDQLKEAGKAVIAVGKIRDIFAGKGITEAYPTQGNQDGLEKTLSLMERPFEGLCFINLVDYDMLYGHRNDVDGYAKALTYFDGKLPELMAKLQAEDLLMITADHGCDPGYLKSTDHSREYTPFLMYGKELQPANLGTRATFADIGATVLDYFGMKPVFAGKSML